MAGKEHRVPSPEPEGACVGRENKAYHAKKRAEQQRVADGLEAARVVDVVQWCVVPRASIESEKRAARERAD